MTVRTLSLNTKLVAGCMVMLGFSLVLSTSLIVIFGSYYIRADRDVVLLTVFKRVLVASSDIMSERSPIHVLLEEEPGTLSIAREHLAGYRAASNESIDAILRPVSGELNLTQDPELVVAVDKVRKALAAARQDLDQLLAMPRSDRSADKILQSIRDMFVVADLVRPIAVATIVKITAEDQSVAGPAMVAQMFGDLRDYSGRLISQLVPFVSTRSPIPDSLMFDLARTRERILEIWQLAGRQGGLYGDNGRLETFRQQINARFFGQGLPTIDRTAATGRLNGNFGITTAELTERYIPTLTPIEQLRTGFLDVALERLMSDRSQAFIWLLVMSAVAVLIVAATLALIIAGRHFVLRPLMSASDYIVGLAKGDILGDLKSPTNSSEILRLFDALEGLRIILSEREQHTERLKILSETDGLTGLINRRLFDRIGYGEPEFSSLSREVSVVMMDLDRFKGINDTYGHLSGDLVLKRAAAVVQRVCRKSDVAARYGGEEIAIVIFESDPWVAMHVAERIRAELEAEQIILADGRRIQATASFGVAHGMRGAPHWLGLVKAADGALYEAKASGRNRVCRATGTSPMPTRKVA